MQHLCASLNYNYRQKGILAHLWSLGLGIAALNTGSPSRMLVNTIRPDLVAYIELIMSIPFCDEMKPPPGMYVILVTYW